MPFTAEVPVIVGVPFPLGSHQPNHYQCSCLILAETQQSGEEENYGRQGPYNLPSSPDYKQAPVIENRNCNDSQPTVIPVPCRIHHKDLTFLPGSREKPELAMYV